VRKNLAADAIGVRMRSRIVERVSTGKRELRPLEERLGSRSSIS
jgi:hypothetical protein